MNDKFLIHVEIADKTYGLWIDRSEEELARKAAKQIKNKINQYDERFASADLDMRDLLAMVALQLSMHNLQLEDRNDTTPFTDKIFQLTNQIEDYLTKREG
ncbi:MAG: cell division protein ZapA [Tannerellaceae bacterium]|nr:cell division protein ZapA [Tannerellaceae bacterium]MCD8263425.1 cell division protein ZapA [Tannerellaceae bacterium]